MKKRLFVLLNLFLFLIFSLSALSLETIYYASSPSLKKMAEARGLDSSLTDDEIRSELYSFYGYESVDITPEATEEETAEDENKSYTLSIRSAENVKSTGDVLTLTGNVVIDFIYNNEAKKTLSSSTIIVDSSTKKLVALGNAKYSDENTDAGIKEINADILTVMWADKDIYITNGTTITERENSEKKKVNFYTSGNKLSYLNEGAIIFDDGYITSNPKTAYSSISAKSILILPGQDMFLSDSTFNIGRVPIIYLPFFFFPGSKILGNPSFGFSSTKGAFLNTTFELLGEYPKLSNTDEDSSFSSLLKSPSKDNNLVLNGYYYSNEDSSDTNNSFASRTKSYLALIVDSYKGGSSTTLPLGGVHVGLDGEINLFDKLKIVIFTGLASPKEKNGLLRYYGKNSLSFSGYGLSLSLTFPYYSDRTVLNDYGNRLTGFSYGPLLGGKSTFPNDYSQSISSFNRNLNLSFNLPSLIKIPFVSSFSIKKLSIESSYSISSDNKTTLDSYSLPIFSLSLNGTLLSLESKEEERKDEKEEVAVSEEEKKEITKEEKALLLSLYSESSKKRSSSSSSNKSKLNLTYSLTEDFSNKVNYKNKEKNQGRVMSSTYVKFGLNGNIGSLISISNTFSSSLNYTKDSTFLDDKWNKTIKSNPVNTFKASIDYLGLTYNLSFKPFDYKEEEGNNKEKEVVLSKFDFSKEYIKTHNISISKSIDSVIGTFSGSISYNLPPLDGSLTPTIKWSKDSFSSSLSWLFKEENGEFKKDLLKLTLQYSSTYFILSNTNSYQTNKISEEGYLLPLSSALVLRAQTKDKKYYIEESVAGDGSVPGFLKSSTTTLGLSDISFSYKMSKNNENVFKTDSFSLKSNINSLSYSLWKNRLYFSFSLDSTIYIDALNKAKSYFTMKPSVIFSIAEFIDVKFSFTTQNNKLGSYFDKDKFSFGLMCEDLLRSIDFFGNGRSNTFFILQSSSIEVTHYMEDWNLNFKYYTSFNRHTDGNKTTYSLMPAFSIYLSWNTMPDLKVEENWVMESNNSVNTWKRK